MIRINHQKLSKAVESWALGTGVFSVSPEYYCRVDGSSGLIRVLQPAGCVLDQACQLVT